MLVGALGWTQGTYENTHKMKGPWIKFMSWVRLLGRYVDHLEEWDVILHHTPVDCWVIEMTLKPVNIGGKDVSMSRFGLQVQGLAIKSLHVYCCTSGICHFKGWPVVGVHRQSSPSSKSECYEAKLTRCPSLLQHNVTAGDLGTGLLRLLVVHVVVVVVHLGAVVPAKGVSVWTVYLSFSERAKRFWSSPGFRLAGWADAAGHPHPLLYLSTSEEASFVCFGWLKGLGEAVFGCRLVFLLKMFVSYISYHFGIAQRP